MLYLLLKQVKATFAKIYSCFIKRLSHLKKTTVYSYIYMTPASVGTCEIRTRAVKLTG